MEREVSAYLVKLRREHPFLATLSLYMNYRFDDAVERFSTDGRTAIINPQFFKRLSDDEQMGTLMHVTMHSALLHPVRRGARIPEVWNIASDIVVNEIITGTDWAPPPDTAVEPRYAGLSVEQVYAKLLASASRLIDPAAQTSEMDSNADQQERDPDASAGGCDSRDTSTCAGGVSPTAAGAAGSRQQGQLVKALQTLYPATPDLVEQPSTEKPGARADRKKLEGYWKRAMTRAQTAEQMSAKRQGDLPAGLEREIEQVLNPQLDWRVLLWRFMARTPCDYSGFDRRFIHQGLYLDNLEGESLNVHIAMDTSGSIDDHELAQFRAEVETIVRCYANIDAQLYFVDAAYTAPTRWPRTPASSEPKAVEALTSRCSSKR